MKEYNEYKDKLCDPLVSGYLKALGCDIYQPECWIVDEKVEEMQLDHVVDSWSGLIPEGMVFNCYRYTLSFVMDWLRENYNLHIFIGWRPNVQKWDSHHYPLDMEVRDYKKMRNMKAYTEDELFETYEEALESGIKSALEELVKDKFYNI